MSKDIKRKADFSNYEEGKIKSRSINLLAEIDVSDKSNEMKTNQNVGYEPHYIFPVNDYLQTPLEKRRHQFRKAVKFNQEFYEQSKILGPVPFIIDQRGGMSILIRTLEDIKLMSAYQVRKFLCGYELPIMGNLNEMMGCLAVGLGASKKDALYTFDYIYEVTFEKYQLELGANNFPDNVRPIHGFANSKYSYFAKRSHYMEAYVNNRLYRETKRIDPLEFLVAQPEGMPYYIQTLDDIKRLTEDEVKVFLRGYNQPIKGTLNEMKRWLALMLGVSYGDAVGAFGDVHYVKQYTEKDNEKETSCLYEVSLDYRKEIFWKKTTSYYLMYEKERVLEPVPFVVNQSEIMPFHIRRLDDIKKLTEDQVELYLRGYCQPVKATLNENKRWLAMILGVSREDADAAFACES